MEIEIDHYGQWSNLFRERPEIHDQVRQLVEHEASLPEGNNPWAADFVSKRCWATKDVTGVAPNTVNLLHRPACARSTALFTQGTTVFYTTTGVPPLIMCQCGCGKPATVHLCDEHYNKLFGR